MSATMEPTLPSKLKAFFPSSSTPQGTTSLSIDQNYLIGLRGLFVFQSFLYVFFQTFLPAALPDSKNVDGMRSRTRNDCGGFALSGSRKATKRISLLSADSLT